MADRIAQRRIWGWMAFDWASQPYATLLLTFIFAPYFATVVGDPVAAQSLWGTMLTVTGLLIAVMAPVLGAWADSTGRRMPWIAAFSVLYVVGSAGLWVAVPEAGSVVLVLVLFGIGLIGLEFATIFTNALLPGLGVRSAIGRISGNGWALGYAGGVLALIIMLLFFAENDSGVTLLGQPPALGFDPEAREGTRFVGPFVALWFVVFMVPFVLFVRDTEPTAPRSRRPLRDLGATLRRLPANRSLSAYLASSMLYRDALNGFYTFGGIYAVGVLEWSVVQIGIFGIMAAITGAVFSWLGGRFDSAYGPKPVIAVSILILTLTALAVTQISRDTVLGFAAGPGSSAPDIAFYIAGAAIGAAGGSLQTASRTMLVVQANPARMTEAFGLYALAGKATAFLAPLLITVATEASGNQRAGVAPLVLLFLLGLVLLLWVKADGTRAEQWPASSPSSP